MKWLVSLILVSLLIGPTTVFAADSTPSADVQSKLKALQNEIASKAAKLKNEISKKLQNKAYIGVVKSKSSNTLTLATRSGTKVVNTNQDTIYEPVKKGGIKEEDNVTEDLPLEPLTDYSKYKLLCETMLQEEELKNCDYTILRPATVCGYAPRLRLDLTVNILTIHALVSKKMTVLGGNQLRPHIYIEDIVEAYCLLLEAPREKIAYEVFNAGYENRSVLSTAQLIQKQLSKKGMKNIELVIEPTNDHRSYYIDSSKIQRILCFKPQYSLENAVDSLIHAYQDKKIIRPLENPLYYNIKRMKEINLV